MTKALDTGPLVHQGIVVTVALFQIEGWAGIAWSHEAVVGVDGGAAPDEFVLDVDGTVDCGFGLVLVFETVECEFSLLLT